jgi:hypothetical protein
LSVVPRTVRGVNLREQAIIRAAANIWEKASRPVAADVIAEASGFDYDTTQQILKALDAKGYFRDAQRGDDQIDAVAF